MDEFFSRTRYAERSAGSGSPAAEGEDFMHHVTLDLMTNRRARRLRPRTRPDDTPGANDAFDAFARSLRQIEVDRRANQLRTHAVRISDLASEFLDSMINSDAATVYKTSAFTAFERFVDEAIAHIELLDPIDTDTDTEPATDADDLETAPETERDVSPQKCASTI
jgi:hypothetical protein